MSCDELVAGKSWFPPTEASYVEMAPSAPVEEMKTRPRGSATYPRSSRELSCTVARTSFVNDPSCDVSPASTPELERVLCPTFCKSPRGLPRVPVPREPLQ